MSVTSTSHKQLWHYQKCAFKQTKNSSMQDSFKNGILSKNLYKLSRHDIMLIAIHAYKPLFKNLHWKKHKEFVLTFLSHTIIIKHGNYKQSREYVHKALFLFFKIFILIFMVFFFCFTKELFMLSSYIIPFFFLWIIKLFKKSKS